MYYEEERQRPRRRRKRRGGILGWLLGVILRLLLIAAAAAVILYALPVSLFMTDTNFALNPSAGLDTNVINVLLLGVDSLDEGSQRSDTIMIASIGYDTFRLTSIMRDTIVDIPGRGTGKLNAAYAYGGAELTVRTLNENFSLNITDYAVVDFVALAEIINALGGVDMAVTRSEQDEINKNLTDAYNKEFAKNGYALSDISYLDLDFSLADSDGRVSTRLDGFQALAFARIRSLDSDYMRTSRQRRVLSAAITEFRSKWYRPKMLVDLVKAALANTQTNMSVPEILSLGSKVIFSGDSGQLRLPADGTFKDNGSALTSVDYKANLEVFKDFVYGE